MMVRETLFVLSFVAAPFLSQAATSVLSLADSSTTLPTPWELKIKEGDADYRVQRESGVQAICLTSRTASFSIQRKVEIDLHQVHIVTWKWIATEIPRDGDLRRGKSDDQAAQLFVLFEGRRSIVYVWDSNAPVGTVVKTGIPWIVAIQALVVESGGSSLNSWKSYNRDIRKDYQELFGEPIPKIVALRFQINSQHTKSNARACISAISFSTQ